MTVRLHIERLVIDPGLGAAGTDSRALHEALQTELAQLLAGKRAPWRSSEIWRVQAPPFAMSAPEAADTLGMRIAGALHECLRVEQEGPNP